MQGIGAPILANISKEELLGRLSPAQRKKREIWTPRSRKAQEPGQLRVLGDRAYAFVYFCSKFKFPRSNCNGLFRFNMVCIIFKYFMQLLEKNE